MKTILASILAVAFLASTPVFAADNPAGNEKGDKADKGANKDDKKKDEKKADDKKAGGGW